LDEAAAMAAQGNMIPVYVEEMSDLLTPVSAYLKVCLDASHSFLFESVAGGEKLGRHSFLGCSPLQVLRTGDREAATGDPLLHLEAAMCDIRYVHHGDLPTFAGGAIGYVGFDCVRHFEPKTEPAAPLADALPFLPESVLMFCDTIIVFDHLHHGVKVVTHLDLRDAPGARHALRGRRPAPRPGMLPRRLTLGAHSHLRAAALPSRSARSMRRRWSACSAW
jgi:anthranilate synthase component 1